jgi:hypothetical protein
LRLFQADKCQRLAILAASAIPLFFALVAVTQAGSSVAARLSSPNASEEASGTLALDGYNLAGHLTGEGIDVTISGTVKSSSVSVAVAGHIMPSCNLNRQSMSGDGDNLGANTSIALTFSCVTKAGNFGGGQDYLFRLDLQLPPHHLQIPGGDSGESAAIERRSGEIQRDLA